LKTEITNIKNLKKFIINKKQNDLQKPNFQYTSIDHFSKDKRNFTK